MSSDVDERAVNKLAAAYRKLTAAHNAFDVQARQIDDKRLQEEDALQCRRLRACRCAQRSTARLEVTRAREDDARLHDVICNDGLQQTRSN